ncbi:hypothetical protein CVIRNUC_005909 [Coccomyxa viridis]|uniref:Splicing factor 45 n=1 Tax=Coccomyxa viridis TaxID=1274662 RepID=A0AAV1I5P7_9CHLO|nr:hypothetical protein CVIRNUC_005909 [Coccomyxa viridis]
MYSGLPEAKSGSGKSLEKVDVKQHAWAIPRLKPSLKKSSTVLPTNVDTLHHSRSSGLVDARPAPREGERMSGHSASSMITVGADADEYDPARPNDYNDVRDARQAQRKEAELEAVRQERLKAQQADEGSMSVMPQHSLTASSQLNLSGEEAYARRARSGRGEPGQDSSEDSSTPQEAYHGMGLAAKMMAKMGWTEGRGLGKSQQGMTTPLMAHKKDGRSGIIVNADSAHSTAGHQDKKARIIRGVPSKVILLRNMVGPGEVDDDLEDEVGMECSKYGGVQSVLIFEVLEPGFNPEEAVRIFVRFGRIEDATKALVDLGGRFFGGRTVSACFFDEDKFNRQDLAPKPNE